MLGLKTSQKKNIVEVEPDTRNTRLVGAAWDGGDGGMGLANDDKRGQSSVMMRPGNYGSPLAEDGRKLCRRDAGRGKMPGGANVGRINRRGMLGEEAGGFRGCSAAKRRPLEGALPMRGYYVSPLLDSCFNLMMLREPVVDPADSASYINQTRDKLEQRRREQVLAERRRLFSLDSDFASRKNARIAGRGSSKVPRSKKLLTQRHGNAGFTRELMSCKMPGIGTKCPRTLRSHFMGLQNFEYDWGAGAK
eukprot:jgi/Undpi1/2777/HiC_scaffold_14.g06154.m1